MGGHLALDEIVLRPFVECLEGELLIVVAGEHHWDFELFRVLPGVIDAQDAAAANAAGMDALPER